MQLTAEFRRSQLKAKDAMKVETKHFKIPFKLETPVTTAPEVPAKPVAETMAQMHKQRWFRAVGYRNG